MNIAILGATSHVAKNLIVHLGADNDMSLYARAPEQVSGFLKATGFAEFHRRPLALDSFPGSDAAFDAVINCIGFGTPEKIRAAGVEIFRVTEFYDNMVLDYLEKNCRTVYVNFSSGAVYGTDFSVPVSADSEFRLHLSSVGASDAYRVSKLNSEAKHRTLEGLNIIDLRLFSLFTRYIDMSSSYLVVEMVKALRENREFLTDRNDIVRDFVHPADLAQLVSKCLSSEGINKAVDVYSKEPISKSELVRSFGERFSMKTRYKEKNTSNSPTGKKSQYYSSNRSARTTLGYEPEFTSLEALFDETAAIISR